MVSSWKTVFAVGSLIIALISGSAFDNAGKNEYVVILDGGSSHTTAYVYQWSTKKLNGTGLVLQRNLSECSTVLSDYKSNPTKAGASLKSCLDSAKNEIPEEQWSSTRILLGATAGMRLVVLKDAAAANAIIQSVQNYVKNNYKFLMNPSDVGLLAPEKEAGYAWTSINFVQKILEENSKLDEKNQEGTWGSLDVGGASVQFAMENNPTTSDTFGTSTLTINAFGQKYNLQTWSFLCFGHDEAYRRFRALLIQNQNFVDVVFDSCAPTGPDPIEVKHDDYFAHPCRNVTVPETLKKYEPSIG